MDGAVTGNSLDGTLKMNRRDDAVGGVCGQRYGALHVSSAAPAAEPRCFRLKTS